MLFEGRWLRQLCGAAVCVVGVAWPSVGRAQSEASLNLSYDVPAGCPDRETFLAEVRDRVTHWPPSEAAARDEVRVRIELVGSDAAPVSGTLVIASGSGVAGEREIHGESCADVATALAAFLALALDVAWAHEADADAGEQGSAPSTPAPSLHRPAEAPPPRRPKATSVKPSPIAARWSGWARAGVVSGTADHLAPHLALGAEVSRGGAATAPLVRLGLAFARSPARDVSTGSVAFTWAASAIDVCLASSRGRWTVRTCLAAELGALLGQSFDLAVSKAGVRPWVGAGGKSAVAFALRAPWSVELELAAVSPLVRVPFLVEGERAFEPPFVAFRAGLGIAYRFR